jgi:transcriptional regulator with XRE-family HTH domain
MADVQMRLPPRLVIAISRGAVPLKALREWRELGVEDLAAASGVSAAVIRFAEGGGELRPAARSALAQVLRVSEKFLVDEPSAVGRRSGDANAKAARIQDMLPPE